jgi:hypothetical protein
MARCRGVVSAAAAGPGADQAWAACANHILHIVVETVDIIRLSSLLHDTGLTTEAHQ